MNMYRRPMAHPITEESAREQTALFTKKSVEDVDVRNKRVLVRVDFNVPLSEDSQVADDTRVRAALPTIEYLRSRGAKVILMSHLGRPEGDVVERFRLRPVALRLSKLLGIDVPALPSTVTGEVTAAVARMQAGDVILLENLRFNKGETENDPAFARKLADLADIYVNDAFGAAHRDHASVTGVARYLPACAGLLFKKEIETLRRLISKPERPFLAILGGNKISDKLGVIDKFIDIVDGILTGGGMCFTFLKAKGLSVGKSLCETDQVEAAARMIEKANEAGISFYLPSDLVVATELSAGAPAKVVPIDAIPDDWMGLDIGPKTQEIYSKVIARAKTAFWNGPMGVFEIDKFAAGTRAVAEALARNTKQGMLSIVGGGDSDAALKHFGLEDQMYFVSTGGGASLKVLEGTPLPGLEALQDA